MLRNVPLLFLFFSVHLMSCENTIEDKAKDAIRNYLNENLDDVSIYESVKFSSLDTLFRLNISGAKYPYPGKQYLYRYQMFHSYWTVDENGRKYLERSYFILNNNFEVIVTLDWSTVANWKNVKQSRIPSEIDINDFLHLGITDTVRGKEIGCYSYINSHD